MRAEGLVKDGMKIFNSLITPLTEQGIGIHQLPCPELFYEGLKRSPADIDAYDNKIYRANCIKLINDIVLPYMLEFKKNNYEMKGIIGIRKSPSCDTQGVFFQELKKQMNANDINMPMIAVHRKTISEDLAQFKIMLQ